MEESASRTKQDNSSNQTIQVKSDVIWEVGAVCCACQAEYTVQQQQYCDTIRIDGKYWDR